MIAARRCHDLQFRLRDFARGSGGAAAIEFAALLPFMLAVYLGGVEVSDGIAIDRKVAITTRAVADLASQYTVIYDADMSNILGATTAIIAPYPPGPLAVTISEITTNAGGQSTVTWSNTLNGTALTVGQAVTLPGTLAIPNSTVIWGQVSYAYTPTLGYVLTGTWNISDQMFMSPRDSSSISRISP